MRSLTGKYRRLGVLIASLALVSGATACGDFFETGPSTPNPGTTPDTVEIIAGGILMGTVSDTAGNPLGNVDVRIGSIDTRTNDQGWFTEVGLTAAERVIVRATADGYVDAYDTADIIDGDTTWIELRMGAVEVTESVDPATGGAVASGTQTVTFPPDAFVDADTGAPIVEPVQVSVTSFDYSNEGDIEAFPGDFVGRDASGVERPLESFGFVDVTLGTASGAEVALAPGITAELRLDSAVTATAPDNVPLWYFDTEEAIWVEDGLATRDGTALVGSVTHFTSWNFDLSYDAVWLNGRVVDASGLPLSNAHVEHRGVSYRGGSARHSDSEGRFRIPVNPNSSVVVWAVYRGQRSENVAVTTPDVGLELDIGDIIIGGIAGSANASFTLSWGQAPSDLDSHLWTPSGAHISYAGRGSLSEAPFAYLNTDDTSSFGPEITTVTRLEAGAYVFCVFNYSGSPGIEESGATVTYSDAQGRIEQIGVPTANPGALPWWRIAVIQSDGSQITSTTFDGSLVAECDPAL